MPKKETEPKKEKNKTAEDLAKQQREISVAEFFEKNQVFNL